MGRVDAVQANALRSEASRKIGIEADSDLSTVLPAGNSLRAAVRLPEEQYPMDTVLVVEDSRPMQRTLQRLFEADGLQVQIASDGVAGLESFRKRAPNIVVLDLKLPHLPGKELCRAFKAQAPAVPIVVLSANAEVEDKVLLLELGADDYVTKPFSPRELLARVRRAMRRGNPAPSNAANLATESVQHELLMFGNVKIDFTSMEATRAGKRLTLTAQEFKLLRFLARTPDAVVSREKLLNDVWGYENYPTTRTVDNHILRLRQKLEPDPANPRYFLTMHGAGYKFTPGAATIAEK
jgi:two-component system, OmpR family, alkaline phosphatase synthesis response regulator PhoP